ncbi:hypothetical protein NW762_004775 [Fusarium torreyae]|uniref:Uncharacterized protein n=1 Tax=Fusarium torreyae TaxID=1237075 RepID=A0A9W8S7J1_9HYPO|nr:hypothetical protein NW762_004775 [Fusarium torreyae]
MCRGENVQCKECSRLSTRIVQLCIRGELMSTCPEIVIEGVSLEKEECRLCRYGNAKAWRASKEQPMPQPIPKRCRLKPQNYPGSHSGERSHSTEIKYSGEESGNDISSWLASSEDLCPRKTNHLQSSRRVEGKFMVLRTELGTIREEQTVCEQLVY